MDYGVGDECVVRGVVTEVGDTCVRVRFGRGGDAWVSEDLIVAAPNDARPGDEVLWTGKDADEPQGQQDVRIVLRSGQLVAQAIWGTGPHFQDPNDEYSVRVFRLCAEATLGKPK